MQPCCHGSRPLHRELFDHVVLNTVVFPIDRCVPSPLSCIGLNSPVPQWRKTMNEGPKLTAVCCPHNTFHRKSNLLLLLSPPYNIGFVAQRKVRKTTLFSLACIELLLVSISLLVKHIQHTTIFLVTFTFLLRVLLISLRHYRQTTFDPGSSARKSHSQHLV